MSIAETATTRPDIAKTYMARQGEVEQKWYLVDAAGKSLGRLASDIAMILMGKHRPTYTPHVDTGEYVMVVNCEKVRLTGRKAELRGRTWYTGYTGQRSEPHEKTLQRRPEMVITEAVRRMLPKSKLGRKMLQKLKVYSGNPEPNPHNAQQPEPKDLG